MSFPFPTTRQQLELDTLFWRLWHVGPEMFINHVSRALLRALALVLACVVGYTGCDRPPATTLVGTAESGPDVEQGSGAPTADAASPESSSVSTQLAYGDVVLPEWRTVNAPERPVTLGQVPLPPAWLIVADRAFPATFGSFTWSTPTDDGSQTAMHGDAIEAERMAWLAKAPLKAGEQALIVIRAPTVHKLEPRLRPWTQEPSCGPFTPLRPLAPLEHDGSFSILRLAPLKNVGGQILYVPATFEQGDVSYYWRLNPVD